MKKLLHRLPRNRWCARLLSILAFAALGLYYPSASVAVVYCKDNSPLTTCQKFPDLKCPPVSKPAYTTTCSTSGGTSGSGSEWQATMKIGDQGIGIEVNSVDPLILESVCGSGFIDFSQDTVPGQLVACTYTPDFGPTAGEPQAAKCLFDNLACRCNKIPVDATGQVGACIGERTSVATCPTPSLVSVPPFIVAGQNAAGCTGTLTVLDINNNPLRQGNFPSCTGTDGPGGTGGCAIQIGDGIAELNTIGKCQQVYGEELPEFARLVASTITQSCSTSNVASDPIVEYSARSTDNFDSAATAFAVGSAKCNPVDGYPPGSCANDSGANITFSADAMFGIASFPSSGTQACNANNFRCGQLPDLTFGPAPSKCTLDKKSGLCQCRCDRCTPDGTLVNAGVGDQGLFSLVHFNSDDAVSCSVRVTGN
jgi:hypothetical protein